MTLHRSRTRRRRRLSVFSGLARPRCYRRRGAMMVGVVVLLPVLFMLAALTINVAHLQLVRTELQIATDAASRAAGRTFAVTGDRSRALAAAQAVAERHTIGGQPAWIEAGDLEFGTAVKSPESGRYEFIVSDQANAVRLSSRSFTERADQAFAPIFPIFGAAMSSRPLCSSVTVPHDRVDPLATSE